MNDQLNDAIRAELAEIYTCLPGEVVAYDGKTVTARPAVAKMLANGETLAPPQIVNLPVHWLTGDGGSAVISVPLKKGDAVVLHFSCRSIENWLSGSNQAPDDPRQFDLTDCFATPVMRPGVGVADTENVSMQYGPGSMKIAPDGTLTIRVPKKHVIADETIFDSPVTINGPFTYTQGMSGSGGEGSSMKITGGVAFQGGALTHNDKNIGSDHKHSGVQPGGGTSGDPV